MPASCINDTVKDIIEGLLYRSVKVAYVETEDINIKIGEVEPVSCKKGEGVIAVSEKGVYITAINERALLRKICSADGEYEKAGWTKESGKNLFSL